MKMRIDVISMILMTILLLLTSCQKAKETAGPNSAQKEIAQQAAANVTPTQISVQAQPESPASPALQPEENVPLVTEVMTKEELQAYLKEKGIPILTKQTFKEPELVWEKTFDMSIKQITDLTDKGNCIAISIPPYIAEAQKTVMFLDNKGNIRKKIEFNDIKDKIDKDKNKVKYTLYPAKSGRYIGVYKTDFDKPQAVFTYYDEEGNKLWKETITNEVWSNDSPITLSYDGGVIAATVGNPRWNEEEESPGDQNINKLMFFDSRGKLLSEYGGFRNVSIGKLSDNGEYYAAIIWWSEGIETGWNKLVYIRTKDGKVLWGRPFPGWNYPSVGRESYFSISEKGSYIAAWEFDITGRNKDLKGHIYNKFGDPIAYAKSGAIVTEDGLLLSVGGVVEIDITKKKIFDVKFNHRNYLNWKEIDNFYSFVSIDGTVLWEIPNEGFINFTQDGNYLKLNGYFKAGKNKIKIYRLPTSGGMQR